MIKDRFKRFLENPKDVPLLVGLISGLYPFLFFYSNNYPSVDTWEHAGFFFLLYVVPAVILTVLAYYLFSHIPKLKPYRKHLLFVLLIMITSSLLSYVMYFTFKKKVLLCILVVACLLSFRLYTHYKRLLVLILFMALVPLFKTGVHIYEDMRPLYWTQPQDDILNVKFKHLPNVYMIQPDGYAGREVMGKPPYSYNNDFYEWLESSGFAVYKDFRSNYPASLASNASIFAMKHHYFNDVLFPSIEMPNARKAIVDNNAVRIFRNNGYDTYFLSEDEYLCQNRVTGNYDHYNIDSEDIPLMTKGARLAREVYGDLEKAINDKAEKPKFIFVEKLLPHHIHFDGTGKENERKEYLEKTREANKWLKKVVGLIEAKDKNALIIILSDHGGWVGMENFNEFYSTNDAALIRSTFGNMAAIRWNGIEHAPYDKNLKTAVNVFRVLFASLSENASYLEHLEKDDSYNIRYGSFTDGIYKLIDENGKIVHEKY